SFFFLLPMIVPTIITAAALYTPFSRLGLIASIPGLVLAHTILALPFVVINVSAILQKLDRRVVNAARSLGASPTTAFWRVTLPILAPGIAAGAVFAFLTSFDEVVVALFISGAGATTLPVQMWSGIRFEISPIVSAASCLLLVVSCLLLAFFWLFKRK
ncbi:ABC transporter permease, partial [Rhizobiaceae sp. 2RAB30]